MLHKLASKLPLSIHESMENFVLKDYSRTLKFLTTVDPRMLEAISQKKALRAFAQAVEHTPAYAKFCKDNNINPNTITSSDQFTTVPPTDKENYIRKYNYEKRCKHGHLPKSGCVDESGGTSGIATNWIHDIKEEDLLFKAISFEFDYIFNGHKKDYFVMSSFSSGPWATGVKFCQLMEKLAVVKNTSTDAQDIIRTLEMFGPKRNYLIAAYPPFVKNLLEENANKIDWKKYNISLVTGGEGVTLDWVRYVKKMLKPNSTIISSYGASDVDIGVGFESPLCFYIRTLLEKNKQLRQDLFQRDDLPMVFQYNPSVHYIENHKSSDGKNEFVITLLDSNAVLSKIRYNLHDEGMKMGYLELLEKLQTSENGKITRYLQKNQGKILHLPFLFIFGRSDGTLSFDGANVFPHQVESAIIKQPILSQKTHRFKMEKKYDKKHNIEFHIHIELKDSHKPTSTLIKKYQNHITDHLTQVNPDFKESVSNNLTLRPTINLYPAGHPLFKADDRKAKNIYFVKKKSKKKSKK